MQKLVTVLFFIPRSGDIMFFNVRYVYIQIHIYIPTNIRRRCGAVDLSCLLKQIVMFALNNMGIIYTTFHSSDTVLYYYYIFFIYKARLIPLHVR